MKPLRKIIDTALQFWWILIFYSLFLGSIVIIPYVLLNGIFDLSGNSGVFWSLVMVLDILPISIWVGVTLSRIKSDGKDKTLHDVVMALLILIGSLVLVSIAWLVFKFVTIYWIQLLMVAVTTGILIILKRKVRNESPDNSSK